MSGRRGLLAALAGCLLGATLMLVAAGRVWAHTASGSGLAAGLDQPLTGRSLAGAVPAVGLVALAGVVAVVAARGRLRSAVGALLAVAGGWVCWLAVRVATDPTGAVRAAGSRAVRGTLGPAATATSWPWVAMGGGVLVALAGLLVAVRGSVWPAMSARYDRQEPARRRDVPPELALWDALDRGDDPT
jgi:uncharacterized membrane protein (TIGR02234 family)